MPEFVGACAIELRGAENRIQSATSFAGSRSIVELYQFNSGREGNPGYKGNRGDNGQRASAVDRLRRHESGSQACTNYLEV